MAATPVRDDHGAVAPVQTALPVVDVREDPAVLRERLRTVAHEVGFFYLTGHGVSEQLTDGS